MSKQPIFRAHKSKLSLISTTTSGLLHDLRRTFHAIELHRRVIRILEPIETPVATRLQLLGQFRAFGFRADPAVSLAPTIVRCTPLAGASVENAHTAARDLQIEMILTKIAAGIGRLDDKRFALNRTASKIQSVASAADFLFGLSGQVSSGESISQLVVDGPRLVGIASIAIATVAAAGGVLVDRISSIFLTGSHWCSEWSFAIPTAADFATIPVTGGFALKTCDLAISRKDFGEVLTVFTD